MENVAPDPLLHRIDPLACMPEVDLVSSLPGAGPRLFQKRGRDRPVKIFAAALDRTLGDFLTRGIYAAAVKMHYANARLALYYRDDRPYKRDLVAINPYIDQKIVIAGDRATPLDVFYPHPDRADIPGTRDFIKIGLADPDIVLTPSMMVVEDLLRFDRHPIFRIPEDRVSELSDRLVGLGLDPNRWFCCLFYRQPNYDGRGATTYRDVDDRPFEALARHIIGDLGGQVVRLGHPGMRSFDIGPGFVDLSRLKNEFMVQAMAVSRARFMVTTSSGPAHLPGAFDVPYVVTNSLSIWGVWTPAGMIMPNHLFDETGKRFDIRELAAMGALNWGSVRHFTKNRGCRLVENSFEELRAVTDLLWSRSSDCPSWRPPAPVPMPAPTNRIDFLQPYCRSVTVVEFPELWPKS